MNFTYFFKRRKRNNKIKKICFQNRDISWLRFNERVLNEAECEEVPVFEKLKFISIFSNNLVEFFMVRVGSIINYLNNKTADFNDIKSKKVLFKQIFRLVKKLLKKQDKIFLKIEKELLNLNFVDLNFLSLGFEQEYYFFRTCFNKIENNLNCVILNEDFKFKNFNSNKTYFVMELKNKLNGKFKILIYFFNESDSKFVVFSNQNKKTYYALVENFLLDFLRNNQNLNNYHIASSFKFKIVRSLRLDRKRLDFSRNFNKLNFVKFYLNELSNLKVVALFHDGCLSNRVFKIFKKGFKLKKSQMLKTNLPISMKYVSELQKFLPKNCEQNFCYKPLNYLNFLKIKNKNILFSVLKTDLLLFYPYEPIEFFLKFLIEAAFDANVTAIKITLYRLAKKSKLIEILKLASFRGKKVVVLIELFARFDEKQNLKYSYELEKAGCKVLFGFRNFKVHSKICLITRKTMDGLNLITQIGTGNYNEQTAKQYSDLSFFTSNQNIGLDAIKFFENMEQKKLATNYNYLLVAPNQLKSKILNLIEGELKKGKSGKIFMKMNSLTDKDIIKKLIQASMVGTKIELNVRGICCLVPKIKNYTENIKIFSVVGRFLEHSRIYCFGKGVEDSKIFIGSADMMARNTQRRVEILVPIFSNEIKGKILKIVEIFKKDNLKSRKFTKKGKLKCKNQILNKIDSQNVFIEKLTKKETIDFES